MLYVLLKISQEPDYTECPRIFADEFVGLYETVETAKEYVKYLIQFSDEVYGGWKDTSPNRFTNQYAKAIAYMECMEGDCWTQYYICEAPINQPEIDD